MAKVRVAVLGTVGRTVQFDPNATVGATLGVNLFNSDGSLLTLSDFGVSTTEADQAQLTSSGVTSHTLLTGLTADDHAHYFQVLGRLGEALTIRDLTGVDSLAIAHDGTDVNFTFTSTADMNLIGLSNLDLHDSTLRIYSTADATVGTIGDDGTDLNVTYSGAGEINFNNQVAVEINTAPQIRIRATNPRMDFEDTTPTNGDTWVLQVANANMRLRNLSNSDGEFRLEERLNLNRVYDPLTVGSNFNVVDFTASFATAGLVNFPPNFFNISPSVTSNVNFNIVVLRGGGFYDIAGGTTFTWSMFRANPAMTTSVAGQVMPSPNVFDNQMTYGTEADVANLRSGRFVAFHDRANISVFDGTAAAQTLMNEYMSFLAAATSTNDGLGLINITDVYGLKVEGTGLAGGRDNWWGVHIGNASSSVIENVGIEITAQGSGGSGFDKEIYLTTDAGIYFRDTTGPIHIRSDAINQLDIATNLGVLNLNGGALTIFDDLLTDSVTFAHDGTDFNATFVNTANWNITGLTGVLTTDAPIYSTNATEAFVAESASPVIAIRETDAAVDEGNWDITSTAGQLQFRAWNDALGGFNTFLTVDRSGFNPSNVNITGASLVVQDGQNFRVQDPTNLAFARFSHDTTDFNVVHGNTTDVTHAGHTRDFNIGAAAPITLTAGPWVGAADNAVRLEGDTNFDNVEFALSVADAGSNRRARFFLSDEQGTFGLHASASSGIPTFELWLGTSLFLDFTSTGVMSLYDVSGADSVAFSHNGTDFLAAFTGTTDWNITGLTDLVTSSNITVQGAGAAPLINEARLTQQALFLDGKEAILGSDTFLRLNNSGDFTAGTFTPNPVRIDGALQIGNSGAGTDFVVFSHNGTDFNAAFTLTADWNITGLTGAVALGDGINLAVGTTTGTIIGTTTSQRLGFFGATPVVQQTTISQTPATFVANTSGIADDTATWNGYTIGDIVAILQAFGLLA